jgi:hypothetical protein
MPEDLRCAVCSLPCGGSAEAIARPRATVLRCSGCGAALTYEVEVRAPKCAFCGAIAHLETPADPIEASELYLPFRVDANAAHAALRRSFEKLKWYHPSDLKDAATIDATRPIWWVGWTFDVRALVSWTADSDAGHGRSAWAPQSGQSPVSLESVVVSASRGLSLGEVSALVPRYDLRTAAASAHAMPGVTIERFDVQRSAARKIISDAVAASARENARTWIPGSTYRNLRVAVLPERLVTRRYAFPAHVLAYRYKGELHRAVVHGQDPTLVLATPPVATWKILLAIAGGITIVIAIVLIVAVILGLAGR